MGLGFGIVSEIKKAVAEVIAPLVTEVREFKTEVREFMTEVREFMTEVRATQKKHTEMLEFLVAELSRFKNDSDELMISMFAFHHLYGMPFTHGDIATKGLIATRFSRKHGFKVAKTRDPRFGEVNLYETEALERCFLGFIDDDYE